MPFEKTTERESNYNNLEKKSVKEIITDINYEDKSVADSVGNSLAEIEKLIIEVYNTLLTGGRLFYIGSGTSGRMGVLDASECPPTFGVNDTVIGLIAGGDKAIRNSQEFAEDSVNQGWLDLMNHNVSKKDIVIGPSIDGGFYLIGIKGQYKDFIDCMKTLLVIKTVLWQLYLNFQ